MCVVGSCLVSTTVNMYVAKSDLRGSVKVNQFLKIYLYKVNEVNQNTLHFKEVQF